jgi:aminopeptidase
VERLWQAVAVAMRLDEADPVQSWRDHLAALSVRRDLLHEREFDRIRFRGNGTDLTVGLSAHSRWPVDGLDAAGHVTPLIRGDAFVLG